MCKKKAVNKTQTGVLYDAGGRPIESDQEMDERVSKIIAEGIERQMKNGRVVGPGRFMSTINGTLFCCPMTATLDESVFKSFADLLCRSDSLQLDSVHDITIAIAKRLKVATTYVSQFAHGFDNDPPPVKNHCYYLGVKFREKVCGRSMT